MICKVAEAICVNIRIVCCIKNIFVIFTEDSVVDYFVCGKEGLCARGFVVCHFSRILL